MKCVTFFYSWQSNFDNMKTAIIILLIGLTLVESSPKGNLKSRKISLPCAGVGIAECTCDDHVTVVTPDGESCFQKKMKFSSCVCTDGSTEVF